MTHQEAASAPNVITGKIFLYDIEAYVLIDLGSTHSFIAPIITSCLHQEPGILDKELIVHTPFGEFLVVRTVYKDCAVRINTEEFPADLIVLPLLELDVILGMDWLTRHRAVVNSYTKEVIFDLPGQAKVVFLR